MLENSGALWIVLGILAAIVVYLLAWRATRSNSFSTKVLIRGGLLVLIAVPLAVGLVLAPTLQDARKNGDVELSSRSVEPKRIEGGSGEAKMRRDREEAKFRERLGEDSRSGSARMEAEKFDDAVGRGRSASPPPPPPAAANGHDASNSPAPGMGAPSPKMAAPRAPASEAPMADAAAPEEPAASASRGMAPEPEAATESAAAPEKPAASASRSIASEPEAAAAIAEEDKGWDVVPVYYGTDRAVEPNPKRVEYNAERARRLELGRALVTVPKIHEVPQIERPWAIRIPYFDVTIYEEAEDREKHFTIEEIKALTKEEFLRLVRERLAKSNRFKDHAIVFVHGYNTSFDHAIYRTAQISYDLKFDGAAFLYSWPSGGGLASYTWDRESSGASQPYMREFLDLVVKQTGAKTVSVIAHSMGSEPLMEVLKDMKSMAPEGVVISQVIFAAPDVDADKFTNLSKRIEGLANGVTLYAASNDRAMIASRSFWQNPRAGDVPGVDPVIVPGVDTIDVTAVSTDALAINHSGYAEKNALLMDIGELIQTGLRPPDQRVLKPARVPTPMGDYWRYTAPPVTGPAAAPSP